MRSGCRSHMNLTGNKVRIRKLSWRFLGGLISLGLHSCTIVSQQIPHSLSAMTSDSKHQKSQNKLSTEVSSESGLLNPEVKDSPGISQATSETSSSRLIKLVVEYEGTYFQGWQSQNTHGAGSNSLTPQAEADAVARMRRMGTKRKPIGDEVRTVRNIILAHILSKTETSSSHTFYPKRSRQDTSKLIPRP